MTALGSSAPLIPERISATLKLADWWGKTLASIMEQKHHGGAARAVVIAIVEEGYCSG